MKEKYLVEYVDVDVRMHRLPWVGEAASLASC